MKWIKQALVLSLILNVTLMALFLYMVVRDHTAHLCFAYRPCKTEAIPPPVSEDFLADQSYEELLALLNDKRRIKGYQLRDFALGLLVSHHHFDLERAIEKPLQKRTFGEHCLYVGLNDSDYQTIQTFAVQETFPYTSKGLYNRLPQTAELFAFTAEFVQLQTLFARTHLPIQKETLLCLAKEAGWDVIETFYQAQRERANYSTPIRQQLLLDAIQAGSRTAAYLLLVTDQEFAAQELSDQEILTLLELTTIATHEAEVFAKQIVESARSDEVCQVALQRYQEFGGSEIAGRFENRPGIGELRPVWRERHPKALPTDVHVVQRGESLWLIAEKYHVSIEELMQVNELHSTVLQQGKLLKIPQSTGS